jgi:hypothetical protein
MLIIPSLLATLFGAAPAPEAPPTPALEPAGDAVTTLYEEIGLDGVMKADAFTAAFRKRTAKGQQGHLLAIADMTLPSTEKRLFVIDLRNKELVMRTWVAHGQNTGELMARHFSNKEGSHQSSLGLYRVGAEIVSPKHGPALLLHGLERGVNDKALAREIIIHGAEYVSQEFIATHGRLGRSWGCPAVPREDMAPLIALLANDGLLYVHGAR